jgi:hypothetical protein
VPLDQVLTRDKEEFEMLAKSQHEMGRARAAAFFDRISSSVTDIPAGVFVEHIELLDDLRARDCWEEMVLSVDFDYFPDSAGIFVRDFNRKNDQPDITRYIFCGVGDHVLRLHLPLAVEHSLGERRRSG